MIILFLILTGIIVGLISTLFGVGGGVIAVPILYLLFPKISPQIIISSSLGMIFFNSIINSYNFYNKGKRIPARLAILLSTGMAMGAFSGVKVGEIISTENLKTIFSAVVLLIAVRLSFSKEADRQYQKVWKPNTNYKQFSLYLVSTFIGGTVAALTGLGGGAVLVPVFLHFLKVPFNWVSFLSNISMGAGALTSIVLFSMQNQVSRVGIPTALIDFQFNNLNLGIIAALSSGSFLSSKFGVQLSERMSASLSRKFFAALLYFISLKILMERLYF